MCASQVKSSEWDSIVSDKQIVVADFWAPWCPHCKQLNPTFESVAAEHPEIKFVQVNVDEEQELASRYNIQGIPAIKFFCEGREIGEILGNLPKGDLKKEVERIAASAPVCLANSSSIRK